MSTRSRAVRGMLITLSVSFIVKPEWPFARDALIGSSLRCYNYAVANYHPAPRFNRGSRETLKIENAEMENHPREREFRQHYFSPAFFFITLIFPLRSMYARSISSSDPTLPSRRISSSRSFSLTQQRSIFFRWNIPSL